MSSHSHQTHIHLTPSVFIHFPAPFPAITYTVKNGTVIYLTFFNILKTFQGVNHFVRSLMYASQLLRILEAFPKNVNDEFYDFDTVESKEAMKDSPRRYTNPFLSDEENEKINLWNNQDFERLNIRDDLTTNYEEDKLRASLVPLELYEKGTELYTDKNVMECELPELLVCYKDEAFHVKDICVDNGIPKGESILFDENNNEMLKTEQLRFTPLEDFYMESNLCTGIKEKIDTDLPVSEPTNNHIDNGENHDEMILRNSDASSGSQEVDADKDCEDDVAKECGTEEEVIHSVVPDVLKNTSKDDGDNEDEISECSPDKLKVSTESDIVLNSIESYGPGISSKDSLLDNASTEQVVCNSVPSLQQDQPLPSLKSLLESIDNQQSYQSPVELTSKRPLVQTTVSNENTTEGNNTMNLNNHETATSDGVHKFENPEHVHERSIEPQGARKDHDIGSDNVAMMHPVYRGSEGESSFSVAGPVSGLITYSGPIAFSGSISLRSDSSTTSTRSFAFPILQNEWNSSPVRMAKADKRRLQKHRGWRQGLLCCRF